MRSIEEYMGKYQHELASAMAMRGYHIGAVCAYNYLDKCYGIEKVFCIKNSSEYIDATGTHSMSDLYKKYPLFFNIAYFLVEDVTIAGLMESCGVISEEDLQEADKFITENGLM